MCAPELLTEPKLPCCALSRRAGIPSPVVEGHSARRGPAARHVAASVGMPMVEIRHLVSGYRRGKSDADARQALRRRSLDGSSRDPDAVTDRGTQL
jgi:hypothetical protein